MPSGSCFGYLLQHGPQLRDGDRARGVPHARGEASKEGRELDVVEEKGLLKHLARFLACTRCQHLHQAVCKIGGQPLRTVPHGASL